MLNCLWCDAPNDQHVAPEAPETIDLASALDVQKNIDTIILRRIDKDIAAPDSEEVQKKIDKHPAGNFMWCAAILGTGGLFFCIVRAILHILFPQNRNPQESLHREIHFSMLVFDYSAESFSQRTCEISEKNIGNPFLPGRHCKPNQFLHRRRTNPTPFFCLRLCRGIHHQESYAGL